MEHDDSTLGDLESTLKSNARDLVDSLEQGNFGAAVQLINELNKAEKALNQLKTKQGEMITRHAWGDIWTRPGLPRHTRSLITIAMLIGMNRSEELKLHLRAAASNGVTRAEIKEVLMQSAIYCGIPAANATFHMAESVWDELGVESRS